MRWPRWLRWPWPRNGDAREVRLRAERRLREAQRDQPAVRREVSRPIDHDEFVNRVRRAFQ